MVEAMQRLDYEATVVYSHDNRIQTLHLIRNIRNGVVHERLQALGDPRREVVREADQVTCYFPERRTLVKYRDWSRSLFAALSQEGMPPGHFYRSTLGRRGQMAGRMAQEIVIQPLDKQRYGRRIWIDEVTSLPLKFELIDHQGDVLEAFLVTDLKVGDVIRARSPESSDHAGWKVIDRREEAADGRWQLIHLPEGFRELRRSRRVDSRDDAPVDHILIGDGLAMVSVYIKQDGEGEFDPGTLRLGGVNIYSRKIGAHLVTVLGDVPLETVRMIGEGVQHQTER